MNNRIDLKKYVPIIYLDILEMDKIIEVDEKLLERMDELTEEVKNNQFVKTANEQGVLDFENILGIRADTELENLAFRKDRILSYLSRTLPYTYRYLLQTLDLILGKGNYTITPDFNNYKIFLLVTIPTYGAYKELKRTLINIVPANILMEITNDFRYITTNTMYISGTVNQSITIQLESE